MNQLFLYMFIVFYRFDGPVPEDPGDRFRLFSQEEKFKRKEEELAATPSP